MDNRAASKTGVAGGKVPAGGKQCSVYLGAEDASGKPIKWNPNGYLQPPRRENEYPAKARFPRTSKFFSGLFLVLVLTD
jgi:hypothetical protein